MSIYRRIGIFVISTAIIIAALAGPIPRVAEGAARGKYSGSWSGSQMTEGMSGRGSGSISFTVDANSGSFSCSFSGSGSFSGTKNVATVHGSVSMSGGGCSGSYSPKTGAVDGSLTINESLHWTYSSQYGSGSDSDTRSFGASISGNVKKGGGSIDYSGGNLAFKVSGSGGDLFTPVDFKDLSEKEKDAALDIMIGDIPPDKLLKMSDKELQDYIDKKFGALDAGEVKGAKGGGIDNQKVEERVERAAKASEGKMKVDAAFEPKSEPAIEDITHEKLVDDIKKMNDPYIREQMGDTFVSNAEKEMGRLSDSIKGTKDKLKEEKGFVDQVKDYTSAKLGNREAGELVVDTAQSQMDNYATEKFEEAIENIEPVKKVYEAHKGAMEIVDNLNSMNDAINDFKDKAQDLKERSEKGHITDKQANMIKALHVGGKLIGKIADKLPIAGAGEIVEGTFEAVTKPALMIATLGKTRDDLVNDPNMNLEGRAMSASEMEDKPKIIERDDPTREGRKIKYVWSESKNCYMQLKEQQKKPDLYDWAKSFFKKKETPAHLKKYH